MSEPQAELSCCRGLRQRAGGAYRGPGTDRGRHNCRSKVILIRCVTGGLRIGECQLRVKCGSRGPTIRRRHERAVSEIRLLAFFCAQAHLLHGRR